MKAKKHRLELKDNAAGVGEKCPHEEFEAEAERFRQATGYLAPGKSQAAAMQGSPSHDERRGAWEVWLRLDRQLAQRDETIKGLRESLNDMMLAVQTFHGKAGWQLYKKNAPEWQRAKAAFCEAAEEANHA